MNLGIAYYFQSDFPKAVECYKKSLKIAREAGDQATVGKAYFSLGTVYQSQSNHLKAAEYYEKSLHIARESGDQYTEWKSYLGRMSTSNSATGSDERGTNLQLARTSHSTGKIIMGLLVLPFRETLVLFCSAHSSHLLRRMKPISRQKIIWGCYVIIIKEDFSLRYVEIFPKAHMAYSNSLSAMITTMSYKQKGITFLLFCF